MDHTFRLDLSGKDTAFIWDVLHGFLENAAQHDRRLIEIRITAGMFYRLDLDQRGGDSVLDGAAIVIDDAEFDDTIELRYASLN